MDPWAGDPRKVASPRLRAPIENRVEANQRTCVLSKSKLRTRPQPCATSMLTVRFAWESRQPFPRERSGYCTTSTWFFLPLIWIPDGAKGTGLPFR